MKLTTYIILVGTAILDYIFDNEAIWVWGRVPFNHYFSRTVGNQLGFHSGGVDVVCFFCTGNKILECIDYDLYSDTDLQPSELYM